MLVATKEASCHRRPLVMMTTGRYCHTYFNLVPSRFTSFFFLTKMLNKQNREGTMKGRQSPTKEGVH